MTEHDTQAAFMDYMRYHEDALPELRWIHAIPNGGARDVVTGARMKREGVKAGVWDVFLPYPCGDYHGLYIEFKHGKNKLTPEQREFGEYVEMHGYKTGVAYTVEEAIEIVRSYLGEWNML